MLTVGQLKKILENIPDDCTILVGDVDYVAVPVDYIHGNVLNKELILSNFRQSVHEPKSHLLYSDEAY